MGKFSLSLEEIEKQISLVDGSKTQAALDNRKNNPQLTALKPVQNSTNIKAELPALNKVQPSAPLAQPTTKEDKIDKWLNPSYKMSKEEKKEAKELTDAFMSEVHNRKFDGSDEEYKRMTDLYNKSHTGAAVMSGFIDALPFYKYAMDGVSKLAGTDESFSDFMDRTTQNAQAQNKGAYWAGNIGTNLGEYAVGTKLLEGLGLLGEGGKITQGVSKVIKNQKLANGTANVLGDMTLDVALDTVPTTIDNARSGMDAGEVAKEAGKNIGLNLAFNVGGETVAKPLINKIFGGKTVKNTKLPKLGDDVVEEVETIAKQSDEPAKALEQSAKPDAVEIANKKMIEDAQKDGFAPTLYKKGTGINAYEPKRIEQLSSSKGKVNGKDSFADFIKESKVKKNGNQEPIRYYFGTVSDELADDIFVNTGIDLEGYNIAVRDDEIRHFFNNHGNAKNEALRGQIGVTDAMVEKLPSVFNKPDSIKISTDKDYGGRVVIQIEKRIDGHVVTLNGISKGKHNLEIDTIRIYPTDTKKISTAHTVNGNSPIPKTPETSMGEGYSSAFSISNSQNNVNDVTAEAVKKFNIKDYPDATDAYKSAKNKIHNMFNMFGSKEQEQTVMNAVNDFVENPSIEKYVELKTMVEKEADSLIGTEYHYKGDKAKKIGKTRKFDKEYDYMSVSDSMDELYNSVRNRILANKNVSTKTMAEDIGLRNTVTPQMSSVPETPGDMTLEMRMNKYSNDTAINKADYDDSVKKMLIDEPQLYDAARNVDTVATVDDIMNNNPIEVAYSEFLRRVEKKDPVAVALGYRLAKQYGASGNADMAVEIVHKMSSELTKSGQFTQAAAIDLMKENPMAAMRFMEKQINKLNQTGAEKFGKKWTDFKMTDDEVKAFSEIEPNDTEAIKELYENISKRIAKDYPDTMWEKVVEASKTAMMLNPRTHLRNVVANAIMTPVRSLSDRVSALGQNAARLFDSNANVTQSLVGGSKAQKKIADEIFDESIAPLLKKTDKWEEASSNIIRNKQVFDDSKLGKLSKKVSMATLNGVNRLSGGRLEKLVEMADESMTGSIMENLRKFDYWLLGDIEDDIFVKKNFSNRLASYMRAQGINTIDDVPAEAIGIAYDEALKATFKDDNNITRAFAGLKKSTGKFGEVLLPFTKTPANIAARGIDYSPAGFINAIKQATNGGTVADVIDTASKASLGTGAIFLGYLLAKEGMIQGALSSDKDQQQFEKQQGKQAFSINVNGKYYTYDWAQPAAIPIILGSAIYDGIKESDGEVENLLNIGWQATKAGVDAWAGLSPISSLQDILGGGTYSSDSIAENLLNEVVEFPQRLYPSALTATAKTIDPTYRQTYTKGDVLQTQIDTLKSKIPVLSKSLPASYDTWGNERKRQDSTESAALANFVNPGTLGYDASTPIDGEINRLFEVTQNKSVFPNKAEWTVKDRYGNNIDLTSQQYSDYQKAMGQTSYRLAEAFMDSDIYNDMSDEDRAGTLSDIYSAVKSMTKNKMFGASVSAENQKVIDAYNANGTQGVINFIRDKHILNSYGLKSNDESSLEFINEHGVDAFKEVSDAIENVGMKQNKENRELYLSGGLPMLKHASNADANNDGKVTKTKELIPYLKMQNWTAEEKNRVVEQFGFSTKNLKW